MARKIKLYYVKPKAGSTTLLRVDKFKPLATIVQNNWSAVADYMRGEFEREKARVKQLTNPKHHEPLAPKPYGMYISDEKFAELCKLMNTKMPTAIWDQGIPILYEGSHFVAAIVMSQSLADVQKKRNEDLKKQIPAIKIPN